MRVGIDSVELSRIKESLEIKGFMDKVYSIKERIYLALKKDMTESAAGNFAAKEAFSKALGTGLRGFSLNEVSILRDELGCPYIELCGRAKEVGAKYDFCVSITHTDTVATAIVIATEK